ncbi:MAG: hypothetical protein F6K31_39600 [Symploca sp. SIO2G7]|nr:hypothetical protein [Symploca sp. SIO2G7]
MKQFFFTTMHESPSLRVSASPRLRVSFLKAPQLAARRPLRRKETFVKSSSLLPSFPPFLLPVACCLLPCFKKEDRRQFL